MAITRLNTNAFGTSVNLASNVTGTLPAANGGSGRTAVTGNVLQVVSTAKTDSFTTTATSDTAVTGLSLSITPSSSSNKIFVIFTGNTSCDNSSSYYGAMSIYRDSTRIVGGQTGATSGSTRIDNVNSGMSILDSPSSTSAITYQLYIKSEGNSSTVRINATSGVVADEKAVITAMEIAG